MKTCNPLPQKRVYRNLSRPNLFAAVAERMEWHKVREGCAQNEITARLLCTLNSPKKRTTVNMQQYTQKQHYNKSTTLQEHVFVRQTPSGGKRQSKHTDVNMLFFASGIQYPSIPVTGT
jgi:hypothetical protein